MSQISRGTKTAGGTDFTAHTNAYASEVNTDLNNLINGHNQHDDGTLAWQRVKATNATNPPLVVNNSSGTNDIAQFQDNGTTVLTIADGGSTTVAPVVTSGTALTVTAANGGSGVPIVANNGTSTGDIIQLKDNGTTVWSVADGGNLVSNSKKITGLPSGTASGDAVHFGQFAPAAYTPTVNGAGTATNITFFWSKVGQMIHIQGVFKTGTAAAAAAYITVPAGQTIDTAKLVSGFSLGHWIDFITGDMFNQSLSGVLVSDASDTGKLFFSKAGVSGSLPVGANGSTIWNNTEYIMVDAWVPVT